jgi:hypothetical protein
MWARLVAESGNVFFALKNLSPADAEEPKGTWLLHRYEAERRLTWLALFYYLPDGEKKV